MPPRRNTLRRVVCFCVLRATRPFGVPQRAAVRVPRLGSAVLGSRERSDLSETGRRNLKRQYGRLARLFEGEARLGRPNLAERSAPSYGALACERRYHITAFVPLSSERILREPKEFAFDCRACGLTSTTQTRSGPHGPGTLCNRCLLTEQVRPPFSSTRTDARSRCGLANSREERRRQLNRELSLLCFAGARRRQSSFGRGAQPTLRAKGACPTRLRQRWHPRCRDLPSRAGRRERSMYKHPTRANSVAVCPRRARTSPRHPPPPT